MSAEAAAIAASAAAASSAAAAANARYFAQYFFAILSLILGHFKINFSCIYTLDLCVYIYNYQGLGFCVWLAEH